MEDTTTEESYSFTTARILVDSFQWERIHDSFILKDGERRFDIVAKEFGREVFGLQAHPTRSDVSVDDVQAVDDGVLVWGGTENVKADSGIRVGDPPVNIENLETPHVVVATSEASEVQETCLEREVNNPQGVPLGDNMLMEGVDKGANDLGLDENDNLFNEGEDEVGPSPVNENNRIIMEALKACNERDIHEGDVMMNGPLQDGPLRLGELNGDMDPNDIGLEKSGPIANENLEVVGGLGLALMGLTFMEVSVEADSGSNLHTNSIEEIEATKELYSVAGNRIASDCEDKPLRSLINEQQKRRKRDSTKKRKEVRRVHPSVACIGSGRSKLLRLGVCPLKS
ncbi:hypothetical protein PIB30_025880 [Stylosanthes scabra]|uniref:Uncharacterized protein n=1 Tax=Stylosanthes scabra TaxID=79078 RepID=A0ABU6X8E2_9FABA|nr:hypothetical protein [Stylosanthes scabra]